MIDAPKYGPKPEVLIYPTNQQEGPKFTVERKGAILYLVRTENALSTRRNVGHLERVQGKTVLVCPRDSRKHFFRKGRMWNLAEEVVCWLALHLIQEVHIVTKKHVIKADVLDWQQHGVAYQHEDYEKQLGLNVFYFKTEPREVTPRKRKGAI